MPDGPLAGVSHNWHQLGAFFCQTILRPGRHLVVSAPINDLCMLQCLQRIGQSHIGNMSHSLLQFTISNRFSFRKGTDQHTVPFSVHKIKQLFHMATCIFHFCTWAFSFSSRALPANHPWLPSSILQPYFAAGLHFAIFAGHTPPSGLLLLLKPIYHKKLIIVPLPLLHTNWVSQYFLSHFTNRAPIIVIKTCFCIN